MDGISGSCVSKARAVIGALALCFLLTSISRAEEPMPVSVIVAQKAALTETIPVVGSLAAREEVQVHPLLQGKALDHILVDVGQVVGQGQPLAMLDKTDALMQLDKNSVSIRRAKAAVEVEASRLEVAGVSEAQARKVLERSQALQPKGAVSQQILDEHENAHARALAELGLARQSLALAEADAALVERERREIELTIERSTVRAPKAGLVLRRAARLGAIANDTSGPLFVIASDAEIEFVAQVTETSFARLGEGMKASVSLTGHDGAIDGVVRLNAAELDPLTRSGEVRIALEETTGLKAGAFARASISISSRQNILLPGSAVKTVSGASNVLVVTDGTARLRSVTVGARQDGFVEITDGLKGGEMIVLKSGSFINDDDKVRPVPAASERLARDQLAASLVVGSAEVAR
ncbi:efflux RND transporter periplasmic adaptor subunit [Rhizobiales bacterium RZME27]|uniref:Efflux RND transporter periplasmic adaptor subunit n=1 Tax=Endobacterium cereale TaxID=2663029 RepID=A0A6A8AD32_9HYPH|nr:efflux RND transporter periplasmic adaptor subunit [Endobacterium cereale]MEB2847193.1 efflux RND transporter periplasmic adaptor subunit [Endobacterium cereale]MQY49042.1 efflux RND transporter periplasmic adaptor subunit [Endobacterium cereale]